jgi:hypothetical protein
MTYNEEKGKSHEDLWGLRSFNFVCVLGAPFYQGGHIGWVGEVQIVKKLLWIQLSEKFGHFHLLTGFQ